MISDFMTKQLKKDNPNHDLALHQILFISKQIAQMDYLVP